MDVEDAEGGEPRRGRAENMASEFYIKLLFENHLEICVPFLRTKAGMQMRRGAKENHKFETEE